MTIYIQHDRPFRFSVRCLDNEGDECYFGYAWTRLGARRLRQHAIRQLRMEQAQATNA